MDLDRYSESKVLIKVKNKNREFSVDCGFNISLKMMRLTEIGQICAAGILLCYETSETSKGVARMLNP